MGLRPRHKSKIRRQSQPAPKAEEWPSRKHRTQRTDRLLTKKIKLCNRNCRGRTSQAMRTSRLTTKVRMSEQASPKKFRQLLSTLSSQGKLTRNLITALQNSLLQQKPASVLKIRTKPIKIAFWCCLTLASTEGLISLLSLTVMESMASWSVSTSRVCWPKKLSKASNIPSTKPRSISES